MGFVLVDVGFAVQGKYPSTLTARVRLELKPAVALHVLRSIRRLARWRKP